MTIQPQWVAPARTALLLIDCQADFAQPDGVMARLGADTRPAQAAIAQVQRLADAAAAKGVARIFTRLMRVPGSETPLAREARARQGAQLAPELCVQGTKGAEFVGPQPAPGELVVTKSRFSAFAGTGLAESLHARGLDTLILCGLTTECCVQSTAWAAFEQEFHVFIASDACAAYEEALHRAALKSLELSGAFLIETGQLLLAWNY